MLDQCNHWFHLHTQVNVWHSQPHNIRSGAVFLDFVLKYLENLRLLQTIDALHIEYVHGIQLVHHMIDDEVDQIDRQFDVAEWDVADGRVRFFVIVFLDD